MPIEWRGLDGGGAEMRLWPHRSLPPKGFAAFFAATCGLAALPLLAVLGTAALWGILPFFVLAIGGLWWALGRNTRDARLHEVMRLWPDRMYLAHTKASGLVQTWEASPYWVKVVVHEDGGPVPQYLTLTGGPREVELGAFLSPEERVEIASELRARLSALR